MRLRRLVFFSLLVSLPLLAGGCAGARIKADYAARQARPLEVTRPPRPVDTADQPPYHLALRVSPQLLSQVLTAMLSHNLLEDAQLKGVRDGQGAEGSGQAAQAEAPRGPFGGFFAQRLKERMGNGARGGQEASAAITPTLHATSTRIGFPSDCDGCLKLALDLQGGLGSPELNVGLGGQVMLKARVLEVPQAGKPALGIRLEEIESLRLELPVSLPGPFSRIQSRLEDSLRDKISTLIADQPDKTSRTIPLAEKFNLSPGVSLEGLGIRTAASPNGELFIGLNTNLTAPPAVTFDTRGPALTDDWAMVLGDEVIEQLVKRSAQAGKMPTRFDRKGHPDPDGPVAFELNALHFTPEGFQIDARIWYFGWPAWWRDYTLFGTIELKDGQLSPHITRMQAGAGDGATFLGRFVEKKLTSEKAVRGMGRSLPNEMPLPMAEGKAARLTPTSIKTGQGRLIVAGRFEVVDRGEAGTTSAVP